METKNICEVTKTDGITNNTNALVEENGLLRKVNLQQEFNKFGVDYVVEQGTDGIWTYRKWNNGIAECWGKKNYGTLATTAWGNVWHTVKLVIDFPSGLFIDSPQFSSIQHMDSSGTGGFVETGAYALTKDGIGGFTIVRGTNATFSDSTVGFYVIGNWKELTEKEVV